MRVFYALNQDVNVSEAIFTPFPGYNNRDQTGKIINLADSDGTSDKNIQKLDSYQPVPLAQMFQEYQYTVDRLPPFSSFRIKIIGTSTNGAVVPQFQRLRATALA